ncbi:S26 family signal peptidase [Ramlibacter humi]|nr:S26 family signal peptidase [Ramlibacter humi]
MALRHFFTRRGSLTPRQWLLLAAICGATAFFARQYLRVGINESPSIKARVLLVVRGLQPDARGQYVAFRWDGRGGIVRRGSQLVKIVAGLPGDAVEVGPDRLVSVSGAVVGRAKPVSSKGVPLEPIDAGRIPAGHLFVAGQSEDSFDSRYRVVGLIRQDDIVGRAYVLF